MTDSGLIRHDSVAAALLASLEGRETDRILSVDGEETDGARFLARVAGRQKQLREAGLRKGDRVFIAGGRGGAFWSDFLAVWGAGCVAIPLNAVIPAGEFNHQKLKAEPRGFIGEPGSLDCDGLIILPADTPESPDTPSAEGGLDDEAAILFTSGSSGEPKGVRLTNRSVLGNALAAAKVIGFRNDDSLFIAIRFHFTSAICHFLAAILSRATLVATEKPMIQAEFYAALRASGCNAFGGAPIQLRWIAECHPADPADLRWVMSSGDRLPKEVIRDLRKVMPDTRINTFYGLTELGGRFCALPSDFIDSHSGSVGRPIEGMHVRILDEEGHELAPNNTGEIVASGEYTFVDYINDPDKTEKVFDGTELRTGDVGYLDDDGMLYVEGRNDDVFKVSGRKVSANLVQHALMECGIFADAAVVRFDHPELGSVARACYALRDDAVFKRGAVLGQLRKNLPKHFLPSIFTELPAIPRTGSGKIDRRALRELIHRIDELA
jgi:acyl-coenzyme A synthetase/AMP-(fatty) acid ligase